MILEMKVPNAGEFVKEVKIETWLVKDGDYVKKGQAIAEVDTDLATLELPAEVTGIIMLIAEVGQTLLVGDLICYIKTSESIPYTSENIKNESPKKELPKVKSRKLEVPMVEVKKARAQKAENTKEEVPKVKQETNPSSSDTSGCLLIIAVIICAVLGFSFYESERRKESFENRTVNELKAVESSDFYNQGKEEQSEPISDPEQNNDTIENNGNEFDNILKETAQEALIDAIIETVSGQSNSQKNIYDCDWCGDEIKGKVYYVNYHGSQYGKDWYVSSNYGQGDYHQSCAYEVCKNKRD